LIPPQLLADGYLARAVHGKQLTLALVEVEPGAVLPEHQHPNEQFGMVIEGSVVFRVGEETRTVEPGGIWRIPPTRRTRLPAAGRAPLSWTSSRQHEKTGPPANVWNLGLLSGRPHRPADRDP
jgi:mannose-6-phosphate isomerase-like protein (cupin superfamily)